MVAAVCCQSHVLAPLILEVVLVWVTLIARSPRLSLVPLCVCIPLHSQNAQQAVYQEKMKKNKLRKVLHPFSFTSRVIVLN